MKGHYGKVTIEKILLPILQNKVITESELLKGLSNKPQNTLNESFKLLVSKGFPLRKKTIDAKWNRSGMKRRKEHRNTIYYLD